jgi:hypothetical protein
VSLAGDRMAAFSRVGKGPNRYRMTTLGNASFGLAGFRALSPPRRLLAADFLYW